MQLPFGKSATTRDLIIKILAEEWPLTIKQLHERVIRQSVQPITYQAVHKVVGSLVEEGVVCSKGRNLELSKNWISGLRSFAESIDNAYSDKNYKLDPNFQGTVNFRFTEINTFAITMANIFAEKAKTNDSVQLVGIVHHAWWPLPFSFLDFYALRGMAAKLKGKVYEIIVEDTPLDRWLAKQHLAAGFAKVLQGVKIPNFSEDIGTEGDFVFQVSFSPETKKFLDNVYARNSSLTDLFKEFLLFGLHKPKIEINVKLTRDAQLAKIIQQQIMCYFQTQ